MENYVEIVKELNEELFNKCGDSIYEFSYETNGDIHIIYINGLLHWNSDEDDRKWNENRDEYEDLKNYLKKEFNKSIKELQKLKFEL
jgi:hypothetical protein